jgi:glycosyl transferase family 25
MLAYLINLARSPERLAHFSAQAARAGVRFERLPAFDGRAIPADERARMLSAQWQFQPLNPGEVGIFLSQRLAWQRLLDSDDAMAAVFEDDVLLSPDAGRLLARLAEGGWNADVVKLETTLRPVVLGEPVHALDAAHSLRPLRSWHGGAAGYVVTRAAAERLLTATWPLADPVDQVLFNPLARVSTTLSLLQLTPALCVQKAIFDRKGAGREAVDLGSNGPAAASAGGAHDVFATTIERPATRGRLLRHGLVTDLRRAWLKHLERRRRQALAREPGHALVTVPFEGAASPAAAAA